MTNKELTDYFVDRIQTGEITFDKVRKELEKYGLPAEDIKAIVQIVDDSVQRELISNSKKNFFDQLIIFGIAIAVIGFVLTIGSFVGLFASGKDYLVIIAYGPFVGGLSVIITAVRLKKRKNFHERSRYNKRRMRQVR